jgi:glycosyltransferase involved in cell wall biosynthesis
VKEHKKVNASEPTKSKPASGLKVVAVIPCFNTEKTIGPIIAKTLKYVDEAVVIDDGCEDNTAEVARAAGARVVSHHGNKGYGAAIKTGFAEAKEIGADIMITIDGDGQHSPDEIPDVLFPIINDGADLTIGSRFLPPSQSSNSCVSPSSVSSQMLETMPRYRKFGIMVISWLWNFGSQIKVTDTQSGFRAYSKRIIQDINLRENGMSISIEILERVREKKYIIREVSATCWYSDHHPSFVTEAFSHGIGVAFSVPRIRLTKWRK